jgi:hypothetical protein
MKFLIIFFVMSPVYASPLKKMQQRMTTYKELQGEICHDKTAPSKGSVEFEINCLVSCVNQKKTYKRKVKDFFVPRSRGLFPANGTTDKGPVWSSLGVSMKVWVQDICLGSAMKICKELKNISKSELERLESGSWVLKQFPGCDEKESIRSPFDNNAKSKMLPQLSQQSGPNKVIEDYSIPGLNLKIPHSEVHFIADNVAKGLKNCQKKIKASICYGDCVDLESSEMGETLATKEPFGRSEVEICGDDLVKIFLQMNPSEQIKKTICDSFFWSTLIHDQSNTYRTCSALRGTVDCSQL